MQIWVHYFPGTGGDGFCNLLEHARGMVSLDGIYDWRIHRYVDDQAKFWSPCIDENRTFRSDRVFDQSTNSLTDEYKKLISLNTNIVISSHLENVHYLNSGDSSDDLKIMTSDRVSVLLYSEKSVPDMVKTAKKKNLIEYDINEYDANSVILMENKNQFDHCVCIDRVISDPTYFFDFLTCLSVTMERQFYNEYLDIVTRGHKVQDPGIEYWKSYLDNNIVKYRKHHEF